jgi:photosystem II stability/assembly factor-like uncharacterized protein
MIRLSVAGFGLVFLSIAVYGQGQKSGKPPFELTWTNGRCVGCKIAAGLGEIQFVSRSEVWGVGLKDELNAVITILVHSTDAGRTWREVPQSQQYTDPDGRLAFSFLDVMRGWVARRDPTDEEPKMISTRDGGQHWQIVSEQFLQHMHMVDDRSGYGTVAEAFFRTNDGGRSWVETKIPDIRFIDRMVFLTPDNGWVAGIDGKDFLVFRTVNGGRDWEQSRTTPPQPPARVRDLSFFDQQRGWLTIWNHINWTPDPDPSFQGKDKQANVVRFTSRERGFVFLLEGTGQSRLMYTMDGGTHWFRQALPRFVYDCQVFEGDLLCSSAPGFRLLTVHPR